MPIHPSAVVEQGAKIDPTAEVGPFCVIGPSVEIGPKTRLLHSVTVQGRASIGSNNQIHPYAVIGGDPQDLKYRGEDSVVIIGDDNIIRESVTINKGTWHGGHKTAIGNRNYIMASAHVAHDSIIEDDCVIANACLLAGHVLIRSNAILSGWVCIHHFVTIGRQAFIGGCSRISRDAPPYMITQGFAGEVRGVNSVGLRRRKVKPDVINALREAHRAVFRSGRPRSDSLAEIERAHGSIPEIKELLTFMRASEKGRNGRARESMRTTPIIPEPEADLFE